MLVHCNKGQSRSVAVTALYLYYKSGKFKSFDDAVQFVKSKFPWIGSYSIIVILTIVPQDKRGLSGNNEVPDPNILALAQQLSAMDVFSLFSTK